MTNHPEHAPEPIEIDDDGKRFREHLEKASRIVSAWPAWKQTVLGGRARLRRCRTMNDQLGESAPPPESSDDFPADADLGLYIMFLGLL